MDWGQIHSSDFGRLMSFGEFDSPTACTAPYVEHSLAVFVNRRQIQLLAQKYRDHVVPDIELFVLLLIVWTPVVIFSYMELVVCSTPSFAMSKDR